VTNDEKTIGGHPTGLTVLFFTELWERFSYYGMRAILVLFMVAPATQGGLGFDVAAATSLYGTYTMSVYFTSLPGGFIADRWLGARLSVLLGGLVMAAGQFALMVHSTAWFYGGLLLITLGTGLLKPNISSMVGKLYERTDPRRDSAFSIFYMGINVGAVLAPLACGYLAQSDAFRQLLASWGVEPTYSWHVAFGAAGVGMLLGLAVYVIWGRHLARVGGRQTRAAHGGGTHAPAEPLTRGDWQRIGVICILFVFTALFWSAYEQKGASLNLFALKLVDTRIGDWTFPSSWLQSMTGFFVIGLAPLFSALWVRLGDRQPSSPAKFALGLLAIGLAYALLVPACAMTASGKISPFWLVGLYFLEVTGEMCLSPVGLSTVTKLAPPRILGVMLGVWFLASAAGNKLAGYFGGFFVADDPVRLMTLYGAIAAGMLAASGVLALLIPRIRRMMGDVH
jgi:POT family proton-dependent oligopeptide transporter